MLKFSVAALASAVVVSGEKHRTPEHADKQRRLYHPRRSSLLIFPRCRRSALPPSPTSAGDLLFTPSGLILKLAKHRRLREPRRGSLPSCPRVRRPGPLLQPHRVKYSSLQFERVEFEAAKHRWVQERRQGSLPSCPRVRQPALPPSRKEAQSSDPSYFEYTFSGR